MFTDFKTLDSYANYINAYLRSFLLALCVMWNS